MGFIMFNLRAKRLKRFVTLCCLSLFLVLTVSCAPVITLLNITNAASRLVVLIDTTQNLLNLTSNLVSNSYQELGDDIRNESSQNNQYKFSTPIIQKMEARHQELTTKYKELSDTVDETNSSANKFFSMLETRANQNTRTEQREKLLNDIETKKKTFTKRIEIAEEASLKVKNSIKEYDNILSVFQIGVGLQEAQKYVNAIDSVISEYKALDKEVQIALEEGRQLIQNSANSTDNPSETPVAPVDQTSPTPTPQENTTQEQINRPYLGVQIITLTQEIREQLKTNHNLDLSVDKGVLVTKVVQNSPAELAGIQPGDVILELNGKEVTDISEVTTEIDKSQVGEDLTLLLQRAEQNLQAVVRLSANPDTSNLKQN
jgi:hypothetical protein